MTLPSNPGFGSVALHETVSRGMVAPNLIRGLEECGFPRPVRSLADPRLDYPELLICSGWERFPTDDGVRYVYEALPERPGRCAQEVEYGPGVLRKLRTSCYGLTQVLVRYADGRMEEWYE